MSTRMALGTAGILAILCSLSCMAQEKGAWHAASSNAEAITSDIALSDAKIAINFTSFPIAQIRRLEPPEISAVFDADLNAGGSGNLYRLSIAASRRFLHHNTLCGNDDTEWMATYVLGRNLQVAFFSGPNMPVLTTDALANSTNLCGTFAYVR